MSQSYVKECIFCRAKIRMSDQKEGKWLPYNQDGSQHDCKKKNGSIQDNHSNSNGNDINLEVFLKKITGKTWDNICPSNQCQIKSDESSLRGKVPIPNPDTDPYINPSIAVTMSFDLHDNVTNKDLTPTQKKLEERYQAQFICIVDRFKDIIKQENNTIYKCSSHLSTLQREYPDEENNQIYILEGHGTYDTKSDTLKVKGNFYDIVYPYKEEIK